MKLNTLTRLALLSSLLAPGCAFAPQRIEVAEVRSFPEYGGYLPLDPKGQVRPEFVAPGGIPHTRKRFEAPATSDEAKARVNASRWTEAGRPLQGVALLPIAAVAAVTWPVVDAFAAYQGQKHAASLPPLLEITLDIRDTRGEPISGAFVRELAAATPMEHWLVDGRRVLGEPRVEHWFPSRTWAELSVARMRVPLQLDLCFSKGGMYFAPASLNELTGLHVQDDEFVQTSEGSRPKAVQSHSSAVTHVFAERVGREVRWKDDAPQVLLWLNVWAPGYEPALVEVRRERPDLPMNFAVTLNDARDRAATLAAYERLLQASRLMKSAYGGIDSFGDGHQLDPKQIAESRRILEELIGDETLADWLRWNAAVTLRAQADLVLKLDETIRDNFLATRVKQVEDAARQARDYRNTPLVGSPSVATEGPVPSDWVERADQWLHRACELGLDRGPDDDPRRAQQLGLFETARELIELGESMDPTLPGLELLRCGLALERDDFETALSLSSLLDSEHYFGMFYGRLRQRPAP